MKIKIGIKKGIIFSDEVVYYVTAKVKGEIINLFTFRKLYGAWDFCSGYSNRDDWYAKFRQEEFPEEYFLNLCKAMYFVKTGSSVEIPDEIEFYKGEHIYKSLKGEK